MHPLGLDLRHSSRLFWKDRGSSVVALLALMLGMGGSTAIFSVVDAVLLKPLPFRDPRRLLVLWEKNAAQHKFKLFVAAGNFSQWRQQSTCLEDLAAVQDTRLNLTAGPNGHIDPEELRVERVSGGLFGMLGVQAAVGRTFLASEDQPGHAAFALLSHGLWQRRFGADPAIAGKSITLRDQNYTVVGVLPAGFAILDSAVDVWLPLGLNTADARVAASRYLFVVARLKPDVTIEQARSEMETIGGRLEQAHPAQNTGWRPSLYSFREELVGEVRRPLVVLLAAVGLLLLMACANVANLLLALGAARRREFAIRTALGASRGRIVLQLLVESTTLALVGGALGMALARVSMALVTRLGPGSIPRLGEARLDVRLFLFGLAVSVASGVLFGILPALQDSGHSPYQALMEGGRSGTVGRRSRFLRNVLVVTEVGLAALMLIGAGLLMRSFLSLRSADPGFRAAGLLTFRLPLAGGRNTTVERRIAFFQQVAERIAALPGVQAVGAVNSLPLTGLGLGLTFAPVGRPAPPLDQRPMGLMRSASTSYFRTMGIPLVAGRDFTAADTAESRPVVVVDQALARRFWPGANCLGEHLNLDMANGKVVEIVGVVGDTKADRVDGEDWPTIYLPYPQGPALTMEMAVRTGRRPTSVASAVERAVHELDREQPVADVRPMESVVDRALAGSRFNTVLLGIFACVAFVMAAVGIYGVMAHDVHERTPEIGLRMALGAQQVDVLKLVLGQGARLAACGIAAGLLAAFALTRLMASMLYGVKATDAYAFAAGSLLLGAVAMVSCYQPLRRALKLDPVAALRHE